MIQQFLTLIDYSEFSFFSSIKIFYIFEKNKNSMNQKNIIVFLLTFFLYQEIKSQSNFQDGYILISQSDTLFGKIDNKYYYENSQFCDFLNIKSDSIIRFYPNNIFGYRFTNGKYYVSKIIEFENKKELIFMEYLVHGLLDFYFYQDKMSNNHYYTAKDTLSLKELRYINEIRNIDGYQMNYTSKPYIGLLIYYTNDCQQMKDDIIGLNEPDHKNLIKFAKKYNDLICKDKKCIIYEKQIPRGIKFSISGGSTFIFPYASDLKQKIYPSYGINILFQQAQKRENFYLGIGFYNDGKMSSAVNLYRIPLSFNYLNIKQGLHPLISYEFDLNSLCTSQAFKIGMKYKIKSSSIFLLADIKTDLLVIPYAVSSYLGLMFDLRK